MCCLSSLNLEKYLEWKDDSRLIEDVMRFLDNVLQDFIDKAPESMSRAAYAAMRERSVGLGVMGFHSFLQSQGVPFESVMAKVWNKKMFKHIRAQADIASVELAEEQTLGGGEVLPEFCLSLANLFSELDRSGDA